MCCNGYTWNARSGGCGYNGRNVSCGSTSLWDLFFGGNQTVCRDCCGNLRVRNGCGCACCNSCNCGCSCGCNGGSGSQNESGNSQNDNGFSCVTFCGNYASPFVSSGTQGASRCVRQGEWNGNDYTSGSSYSYNSYSGGCGCNG